MPKPESPSETQNPPWPDLGLLLLRLSLGSLMLTHGLPKLQRFSELSQTFPDPIGLGSGFSLLLAVGAEVGCSLLLIFGAFTRLATIPLAVTMLVAALVIHGSDPFAKKELALLYLFPYLTLLLTGPGRFALDSWLVRFLPTAKATDSNN
ncbi:MAG: DoxX family protein [Candidatus Sericytochromatia bacterium]|nr:DoxX family protein [Candidatus Sericytochromatia bacterium]